jgi:hypothetical protein
MYISEYTCTYQNVSYENEFATEDVVLDLENCQYRSDILSVFNLEIYDEYAINTEIIKLFKMIGKDTYFSKCFKTVYPQNEESILCLVVLFSFDYFYATHLCISDLIKYGTVKEENATMLEQKLLTRL